MIAELVREAALEGVRDELPHSLAVVVEEMVPREGRPDDKPAARRARQRLRRAAQPEGHRHRHAAAHGCARSARTPARASRRCSARGSTSTCTSRWPRTGSATPSSSSASASELPAGSRLCRLTRRRAPRSHRHARRALGVLDSASGGDPWARPHRTTTSSRSSRTTRTSRRARRRRSPTRGPRPSRTPPSSTPGPAGRPPLKRRLRHVGDPSAPLRAGDRSSRHRPTGHPRVGRRAVGRPQAAMFAAWTEATSSDRATSTRVGPGVVTPGRQRSAIEGRGAAGAGTRTRR